MIGSMDFDEITIECATCPATGTTACSDCLVTHLLANDDGPIDYEPTELALEETELERSVRLFAAAGLLDEPPVLLDRAEFEAVVSGSGPPCGRLR